MILKLLVGNIGSGKSTYCTDFYGYFLRINQDQLGSRYECEKVCECAMKSGIPIIIDRVNCNKKQRITWLNLAKKYNYTVECVILTASKDICLQRVKNRQNHETIKNLTLSQIEEIYNGFEKSFEYPLTDEGICSILEITTEKKEENE